MIRELNEMQRMAGASALALELQMKKNQQLQHKITRMQESIDTLQSQRATAEAQIGRLLDLQERTQAQRDAAQAELNRMLGKLDAAKESRRRMIWAFKRMKQAVEHWSAAHSRALARAEQMRPVVNAARELSATLCGIYGDPEYFMPELEKLKPLDDLLAAYDAARGAK